MAVYFIRQGVTGPVKIGFATDVVKRLRQLQTNQPITLRIIRLLEGGKADEARLHALFASQRQSGEWFSFSERFVTDDFGMKDLPIPFVKRSRGRSDCETAVMREMAFHGEVLAIIGGAEALGRRLRLPPWEIGTAFINKNYWSAAVMMLIEVGRPDITYETFCSYEAASQAQEAEMNALAAKADAEHYSRLREEWEREWISAHGSHSAWWPLSIRPDDEAA